ncbi:hypothetical protein [Streptacidiphilus anmyonensis]|uniref:hypothetical protein n=1 Tax=Streptacidiphilus anmyonensis TaxID=405782 RepID=UPI0005A6D5A0|nr:hypothetical protein [Streptacidiphilus anmyonensis]
MSFNENSLRVDDRELAYRAAEDEMRAYLDNLSARHRGHQAHGSQEERQELARLGAAARAAAEAFIEAREGVALWSGRQRSGTGEQP